MEENDDKENDDSLNLEELIDIDKDRDIEKGKEKTKKNIFKNLLEKINSEKEVFLDINKQDEDLEDYIMAGNSELWDEEEYTNWVDDIDSLEEEENKEETEEKGLFD